MPARKNISFVTLILVFLFVSTGTVLLSMNSAKREITVDVHRAVRNIATIQLSVQEYDVFVDDSKVDTTSIIWGLIEQANEDSYWYCHARLAFAEIDFAQVSEADIRKSNDTLYLVLPQPTVRLDTIGAGVPRVYWFTDISRENREIARAILTSKADSLLFIEVSESSALLRRNARVQAEELVNTLVGSMHPGPLCISFDQINHEAQRELRN